jgi:nucleotide-binding universal stress UspA family protein
MSVVVGVSPTTGSPLALRWGADEARLRGVALRAVLAWRPARPPGAAGGRPPLGLSGSPDPAADAYRTLTGYVTDALGADVAVECAAVKGNAVNALLAAARDADLLVVGEPRPGRLAGVRSGLIAPQLVQRARCPVVVMPPASS